MNIVKLSLRNIQAKPMNTALNILLVATGLFIISFLLLLQKQMSEQLEKNAAGIQLVVGAKGSPLQLVLSTIYHVDYPTGNIKLTEAEQIGKNPLVKKTIPIALGDNYNGFRIVGTTADYPLIYKAQLKTGKLWRSDMEVCIGSKVADVSNLKIGDKFAGVHGFVPESNDVHNEFQYQVTGIYAPSGTVLDQLILTNISSVWQIHHHHNETTVEEDDEHAEEHHHDDEEHEKEITSLLVFYKNPMAALQLPRHINQETNMQAASPAIEINRLYSLMGIGIQSVHLIAYLIILISAFSIFISLYSSMKERKYEIALIRVLGGRKRTIFSMMLLEGLLISFGGFVVSTILSRGLLYVISIYTENNFHYGFGSYFSLADDILLLCISLILGFTASIIPSIKATHTNLSTTLAE